MSEPCRLFVASSSAVKDEFLSEIVATLVDKFDVHPWHEEFPPGQYTLETLTEQTNVSDLALFVFAKDDALAGDPAAPVYVPRDNVVFECGLFLQALSRDRVIILQERGTKAPIDLAGLTVLPYRSDPHAAKMADINQAARKVIDKWKDISPRNRELQLQFSDGGLGLKDAVQKTQRRLNKLANRLNDFARSRRSVELEPFWFDSEPSSVTTYAEALNLVTRRFWTTTFLSSGFWTRNDADVIAANANMMRRVAPTGDVRRLFMLQHSIQDEITEQTDQRILKRQMGKHREINELDTQTRKLHQTIQQLMRAGCKVRFGFDGDSDYRTLPDQMSFDPVDCEIAIYDDERVDVFRGGRSGHISGVKCYTSAMENFRESYHATAVEYFEKLWEAGCEAESFFEQLRDGHDRAATKIDYESNWLALYEFSLSEADRELKIVEINRVRECLNELKLWGTFHKALDVGTCTGRYPIYFASENGVRGDGKVVGIDDDMDCVRFARSNISLHCPNDARVKIVKANILSVAPEEVGGPFNIVTCMLGTLSHCGHGRQQSSNGAGFGDALQKALTKLRDLLAPGGILVLGTWSSYARTSKNMLEIYKPSQRDRLAEWTPPIAELRERRLAQAGLQILQVATPHQRIDLTVCMRDVASA